MLYYIFVLLKKNEKRIKANKVKEKKVPGRTLQFPEIECKETIQFWSGFVVEGLSIESVISEKR